MKTNQVLYCKVPNSEYCASTIKFYTFKSVKVLDNSIITFTKLKLPVWNEQSIEL